MQMIIYMFFSVMQMVFCMAVQALFANNFRKLQRFSSEYEEKTIDDASIVEALTKRSFVDTVFGGKYLQIFGS